MSSKEPPRLQFAEYFLQNKCTYGSACLYLALLGLLSEVSENYMNITNAAAVVLEVNALGYTPSLRRTSFKTSQRIGMTFMRMVLQNNPHQPNQKPPRLVLASSLLRAIAQMATLAHFLTLPQSPPRMSTHFRCRLKALKKSTLLLSRQKKMTRAFEYVLWQPEAITCTFFAQGECRDGAKCQFLHPSPEFPSPENHMVSSKKDVSLLVCCCILPPLISTCTDKFTSVDDQFVHNRNQETTEKLAQHIMM